MKLKKAQTKRFAELVLRALEDKDIVTYKVDRAQVLDRLVTVIEKNMTDELELDRAVNQMMDDLERSNPGEFERYKMFPMLKKKMAKERGFVL